MKTKRVFSAEMRRKGDGIRLVIAGIIGAVLAPILGFNIPVSLIVELLGKIYP